MCQAVLVARQSLPEQALGSGLSRTPGLTGAISPSLEEDRGWSFDAQRSPLLHSMQASESEHRLSL